MPNTDIRQQIKEIAIGVGVEEATALILANKCYENVSWRPYGGATSFKEAEEMMQAQELASKVSMNTYMLESLVSNIMSDEEMESPDDKAEAIKAAADEYKKRVSSIKMDSKSILDSIKEFIVGLKTIRKEGDKYVLYSKDGSKKLGTFDSKEAAEKRERQINYFKHQDKEQKLANGFKVYVDNDEALRWLSLSSNAFEDHDKELFTTKALQEAIEYADKTGERGPLLVYHIPAAEIGHTDFQALSGRFLVESGTFADTPLGNKALEYFAETVEDHQVSIGFEYHDGDELDGQYDWLRIKERSVTPDGAAANPWTSFKAIGEMKMDEKHKETLVKIFGDELASGVIASTEAATKELEQSVRFKEKTPEMVKSLGNLKTLVKALPEESEQSKILLADIEVLEKAMSMDDEEDDDEKKKDEKKEESPADTTAVPANAGNEEVLKGVASMLASLTTSIETLQAEVKELKATEDEKIANIMRPKIDLSATRPSQDGDNVVTEEKIKEIMGLDLNPGDIGDPSPAQKYADDLVAMLGGKSKNGVIS